MTKKFFFRQVAMGALSLFWVTGFCVTGAAADSLKVGLVIDKGGKEDRGFNAAAVSGLERAKRALHVSTEIREAAGDLAHEPLLREFAKQGYGLVIALGAVRSDAVKKVAAEFPMVNFAIVDAQVDRNNVRSILFEEQEGSFLVGAIAGFMNKSGKLGFIGGMDVPVIRRFKVGFEAGAKQTNPGIQVVSQFVGTTSDAWNDKSKAKQLATSQYGSGVDIIYGAAGASNLGIFDAAEAAGKYAIGVSNQNWVKPGRILTSMRKRVDIAVFMTCQDAMTGGFSGGLKRYGLSSQGVDFVVDSNNEKLLSQEVLSKVHLLKQEIVDGKIQVPTGAER